MSKIVINRCFGGFGLSHEATLRYAEIKGIKVYPETEKNTLGFPPYWLDPPESRDPKAYRKLYDKDIERDDPALVQVVEELGATANGMCASLSIEEIPVGAQYLIEEYDGKESIQFRDATDWNIAK